MEPTNRSAFLAQAIRDYGGLSKLALELKVGTNVLANWLKRGVPAERCPDVEALTGLRCEMMRPDVNWGVLRKSANKPKCAACEQRYSAMPMSEQPIEEAPVLATAIVQRPSI